MDSHRRPNFIHRPSLGPIPIQPQPNPLLNLIEGRNTITLGSTVQPAKEEDFQLLEKLGAGACGQVDKMLHVPSNRCIAVKKMRLTSRREDQTQISKDLQILMKFNTCPQIVGCYGHLIIDSLDVWLFLELMASCFDKILKKLKHGLPEEIIAKVAVETLKALDYLKDNNVMHRDVKPSNILINEFGQIKLCDFGISGYLQNSVAKTQTGCTAYLPPERIDMSNNSKKTYDIRTDVWSLGITLVEMSQGSFPYPTSDHFALVKSIVDGDPPQPDAQRFSPEFCDFCRLCLMKKVKNRPKYKELLTHKLITYYDIQPVEVGKWFLQISQNNNSQE